MPRAIYKARVPARPGVHRIQVPESAALLSAYPQHAALSIWYDFVSTDATTFGRAVDLHVVETGQSIPDGLAFLGTCALQGDDYILHVYYL